MTRKLLCRISGCKLTTFIPQIPKHSSELLQLFHKPEVLLKADAKIKSNPLTIQAKIQKIFRELICFEGLLLVGSAIALPTRVTPSQSGCKYTTDFYSRKPGTHIF